MANIRCTFTTCTKEIDRIALPEDASPYQGNALSLSGQPDPFTLQFDPLRGETHQTPDATNPPNRLSPPARACPATSTSISPNVAGRKKHSELAGRTLPPAQQVPWRTAVNIDRSLFETTLSNIQHLEQTDLNPFNPYNRREIPPCTLCNSPKHGGFLTTISTIISLELQLITLQGPSPLKMTSTYREGIEQRKTPTTTFGPSRQHEQPPWTVPQHSLTCLLARYGSWASTPALLPWQPGQNDTRKQDQSPLEVGRNKKCL